jgi:beta-galactosidase/beta-glucuronidase
LDTPRPEYPRPQFERSQWLNLNGTWQFDFDDANIGLREHWFEKAPLNQTITVPFAYQSRLSGIEKAEFHDIVWYQREFDVPEEWLGKRLLLHFGAVDYRAWVWINGAFVTYHEGGHTPFSTEITHLAQAKNNRVVVRVEDFSTDLEQPRGKQFWREKSESIFYTRTTGIWQTVWLEPVADVYLNTLKLTPDIDAGTLLVECTLDGVPSGQMKVDVGVTFAGEPVMTATLSPEPGRRVLSTTLSVGDTPHLWSPENPALYDLQVQVKQDEVLLDEVRSYFGMRKIDVQDGQIRLNNQPYYMRLVLDQGYHPDGLLTFPSDDALKQDAEMTKAMGFNGVRKHQKVEEPRYLYWADHLGLLVWGEMANCYVYSALAVERITAEWQEAVERDYNHPCIVAWVPLNESWGVPNLKSDPRQAQHLLTLYHLTKSLDSTRPVISNDGWEHAKSDFCTIHDYTIDGEKLSQRYSRVENALQFRPDNRPIYVPDFERENQPVLVSEFGGIAYRRSEWEGWGYATADDQNEFIRSYREVVSAVLNSPLVQGFCYTQLTDVEQEINGLLTYDRRPKVDPAIIREINTARDC